MIRLALLLVLLHSIPAAHGDDDGAPSGVRWIDPAGPAGSLVISGGGELPGAVRERFLQLAGGKEARIVVIPTASDQADTENAEARERMLEPWKSLGAADVQLLHTRSRDQANEDAFVEPLVKATAVWFGGGQQSQIADAYLGTAVEREVIALLARGGVVGGTSAGAAIQSKVMIAGGQDEPRMATGFDLLPGAIIDQHFKARDRQGRLRIALAKHPGRVGLGVDEGTALVVRGRRMEVLGNGAASVFFAPGASREAREFELKAGERHDLTMLRRAAIDRSLAEFPPQELTAARVQSGSLVIVGGGGMPKSVVDKFIELAGGPDAPIVVLPTAGGDTIPENPRDGQFLQRAGAKDVRVLKQRTRTEVESPEFAAALADAKGVWFGGGRQWRFIDAYAGTKAEQLFHDVLARGGVIGGSSAGASIQAQYMVRGSALVNTDMMAEGYERGLNFLPGAAVDQHFTQRKRQADMTGVMQRFPGLLGIGLDEGTAIIVQGQIAETYGPGHAHYYDYRNGPPACEPDFTAVKAGGKYDLVVRKIVEAN